MIPEIIIIIIKCDSSRVLELPSVRLACVLPGTYVAIEVDEKVV